MPAPATPIRRTLTQVIALSCGAALAITMLAFLAYEVLSFRDSSVRQLQTLGQAVASNSTAALAFDNSGDATTVLEALAADPHIRAAALFDGQGRLFATYPADLAHERLPAQVGADGYRFGPGRLIGFQPVLQDDRRLGTLYVESDLDAMFERLRLYALTALLVTALSTLAAWLIARRLQHRLLVPILALTDTARAVSDRRDYTVRAVRTGVREFDLLTDTFNQMLAQIQESESGLRAQLGRLSLLQHITRAIRDRQDMASIFQVVVTALEDSLPVDFAAVLLHEDKGVLSAGAMGPRSRRHADQSGLTAALATIGDAGGFGHHLSRELSYEPDAAAVPLPLARQFAAAGLPSLVVAPLLAEGEISGLLVCARGAPQAFSSSDCEFLKQLAEHVALASHQAGLYVALQGAYDDLRQSQLTLLQQERLRALGQMASGIAHDINNAISPVALYTESLLEREPGLSERTRTYLTTIHQAIEDVGRTVSRMREFYRDRETQLTLQRVDVNEAVRQVIDLTRPRWSDLPQQRGIVIELRTELAPELPAIMAADNEIRDALTNLVFNAVDAMPSGGVLSLVTRTVAGADDVTYVVAEVGDTGIGMDENTRRKCLEPFYTTKGERGTGLGLAMVYGMIQRHSAQLEIDSEPGRGTTVRLMFASAADSLASTARMTALPVPLRPLRILLIDDDPMLIRSLREVLHQDGHLVTAAASGQEGIDVFTQAFRRGERFDVVITDLGMPYVDGRKVAAAIKALAAATPVVLLTGWGQRLIAANETPANVDRVLSKPPRLQELRATLAELTQ